MNDRTRDVIKWIGVLPFAILAANLVIIPTHLFLVLYHQSGGNQDAIVTGLFTWPQMKILLNSFFIPWSFVFAGAFLAPSKKFETSQWLAFIYCVVSFLFSPRNVLDQDSLLLTMKVLLSLGGMAFALNHYHAPIREARDRALREAEEARRKEEYLKSITFAGLREE